MGCVWGLSTSPFRWARLWGKEQAEKQADNFKGTKGSFVYHITENSAAGQWWWEPQVLFTLPLKIKTLRNQNSAEFETRITKDASNWAPPPQFQAWGYTQGTCYQLNNYSNHSWPLLGTNYTTGVLTIILWVRQWTQALWGWSAHNLRTLHSKSWIKIKQSSGKDLRQWGVLRLPPRYICPAQRQLSTPPALRGEATGLQDYANCLRASLWQGTEPGGLQGTRPSLEKEGKRRSLLSQKPDHLLVNFETMLSKPSFLSSNEERND